MPTPKYWDDNKFVCWNLNLNIECFEMYYDRNRFQILGFDWDLYCTGLSNQKNWLDFDRIDFWFENMDKCFERFVFKQIWNKRFSWLSQGFGVVLPTKESSKILRVYEWFLLKFEYDQLNVLKCGLPYKLALKS